jgi:hypothetical protein
MYKETRCAHVDRHERAHHGDEPLVAPAPVLRVLCVVIAVPDYEAGVLCARVGHIRRGSGKGLEGRLTRVVCAVGLDARLVATKLFIELRTGLDEGRGLRW